MEPGWGWSWLALPALAAALPPLLVLAVDIGYYLRETRRTREEVLWRVRRDPPGLDMPPFPQPSVSPPPVTPAPSVATRPAAFAVDAQTRQLKQLVHEAELAEPTRRPSLRELARRAGFAHPQQYKRAWERCQAEYKTYLRSAAWKAKKAATLEDAAGVCDQCGQPVPSLDVHHTSYERLGDEPPDDLWAVCPPCHRALHPWSGTTEHV